MTTDKDRCLKFRKYREVNLDKESAKTYSKRMRIDDFIRLPGVVVWDTCHTLPHTSENYSEVVDVSRCVALWRARGWRAEIFSWSL